jgi:leucyl-tRNA synthetase
MIDYNPQKIEAKWQKIWEKSGIFQVKNNSEKPKFYCLDMFPYPSGVGLHVGHPRGYVASDIISRYKRMKGFNVLHPMGWDAFGLPAENYALKTGIKPETSTKENIKRFKEQLKSFGFSYDWLREINTTDPKYYKWTQWIFLQLYKKGLVYESELPINWCPSCKTGLANEEVINGECERCSARVEKKNIRQWVLKITAYADRLLEDLEELNWPKKIKEMQKNWIGRSEGADIVFKIKGKNGLKEDVKIYTTRPDTLLGATFLTLSPEHPLVLKIKESTKNREEIDDYIKKAKTKPDFERTDLTKEKTGVNIEGVVALNPATGEEIPVYIADYVLSHYGYGAIMCVPAYDERDLEFAKKFNLPIKKIKLDKTKEEATKWLEEKGCAKKAVNYKLRDWIFSRQRYWGEPIPLVHCLKCGIVLVLEKELPVKLPEVEEYQPTGTGESPLSIINEWVNTKCPKCSGPAKRETNTMPQWAGSCWYYLRYIDTDNSEEIIEKEKEKYFMPVDLYIGGAEHAVLHLLYARFWHKVLYDIGVVSTKEPFKTLKNQGLIIAEDGQKMSKSKGNTVSPDDIINEYGADTLRIYEMFIGPFDEQVTWNSQGIKGSYRFLEKVWKLFQKCKMQNAKCKTTTQNLKLKKRLHQSIKKVTEDIENLKFNTAISSLMEFCNIWQKDKEGLSKKDFEYFLKLLAPFAPHFAEEVWRKLGNKKSIFEEKWPEYNPKLIKEKKVTLIIQINGKVRDKIEVGADVLEEKAKELALSQEKVLKWIADKKIKKIIFIPKKLINIVIS